MRYTCTNDVRFASRSSREMAYGLPMCDDKKSSQNIYEYGIIMLLVPGNLDLITSMGHQISSEGEKILYKVPERFS